MVKSIGIDPGDQAVKIVELDGNYRKTRLVRVHTSPAAAVGADAGTHAEVVAAAARAALDEGMRGEIILGHPLREAVLRVIELPFKGHDAIRKVVKAEIEGEIYSHTVDDMIVDFHELGETATGGTRVMVASVPKEGLRNQLAALTAQSIETETIDIDTMALWRAAHWAGIFAAEEQPASAAARAVGAAAGAEAVTAIVDLGARSVKVLLVQGEQLIEMRALRLGDAVVADDVARKHGLDAATARDAVRACLAAGTDQHLEVIDALPAPVAGEEPAAPVANAPKREVTVRFTAVEAAQTAYLQRLARELARYLTASGKAAQVRAVWITGGAIRAPGMKEMLGEVFGTEPRELDLLAHLQHDLQPEVAAEVGPRIATALGLALGRLGGPTGFNLRQEDLVLARGFERIKFPLAIACMVALLALFVHANKRSFELKNLELQIGQTYVDKTKPKAEPVFHGMLFSIFSSKWFESPANFQIDVSKGKDYKWKDLVAELVQAPVHRRVAIVRDKLKAVADQKQKESGVYEDVTLESGLAVLVRMSELLMGVEAQLGRFLVLKIDLNMKAPNRRLELVVAFRGDDFRDRMETLRRAVETEIAKADSPFEAPAKGDEGVREDTFIDSADSGVRGAYFRLPIRIKDSFPPFGPSTEIGMGTPRRPDAAAQPEPNKAPDQLAAAEGKR